VSVLVRNWGPAKSDTCVAALQVRDEEGLWRNVLEPAVIPPLLPDSTFRVRWNWQVREPPGNHPVRVVLDPGDKLVELDESNNFAAAHVLVAPDSTAPVIRVFADGEPLLSGDHVAPTPILRVEIRDQGVFSPKDTSRLRILLDDKRLTPSSEPALEWHFEDEAEGKISASVSLRPVLEPGSHILQVTAWDLAGNRSEEWLVLRVAGELEISHVLNVPNPFANFTTFTYFLSLPADEVTIRVFTLSGRKVWETEAADGAAGYNAFDWDGRDQEGDELANGVYLYKITARSGEKSVSALGKLAIVR
ncbi:MAG: T9SS type A sorting domain-containing protein, partial [Calditrichaeota bacterium]|nr:T9SS type A sorting domain-containing protein [Calditrichota bacterium]